MHYRQAALLALVMAATGACSADKTVQGPNYVIFDGSKAKALLDQCSRRAPSLGEGSWMPSPSDIARLEAKLPAAIRAAVGKGNPEMNGAPRGWLRQYVGIVRGGHHLIYGNFFRAAYYRGGDKWRTVPHGVCDGGMTFFGVDYDAERDRIIDVAFNGDA